MRILIDEVLQACIIQHCNSIIFQQNCFDAFVVVLCWLFLFVLIVAFFSKPVNKPTILLGLGNRNTQLQIATPQLAFFAHPVLS